jgi:hypothetical protein
MKNENKFIKKARGQECAVYEVIRDLAKRYNKKFKILKLPEPTKIRPKENQIILPCYQGRKYKDSWEEIYGGALMGLELSREIPGVIYDFSKIDVNLIEADSRINKIPKFKFDYDKWKQFFNQVVPHFLEKQLISENDLKKAEAILAGEFTSNFIFNNGDFYPRNFIKQDSKIIVVDWQTWDENYRACLIDYWENVFAFCFVHMWSNPLWQLEYLKSAQRYFNFTIDNLQKALIIKSFDQANFWFGNNNLCIGQLRIFKNALNTEFIHYLLDYTRPNKVYSSLRPIINLFR